MRDFMSELNFQIEKLKASMGFNVTHKPGADLSVLDYPLLVYAPNQHGPGIRTEDKGIAVADIVNKAAEMPDYNQLAEHFGTTPDHIEQAIAYAVAATPSETEPVKESVADDVQPKTEKE
jgi:uncharacterized protein (DUF433 family)